MAIPIFSIELNINGRHYVDASRALEQIADKIEDLNKTKLGRIVRHNMRVYLEYKADELAKRHGRPYPAGTTDTSLSRRSGRGVKSIKESVYVRGRGGNVEAGIGGVDYLFAHEGTSPRVIRARNRKYLTIPIAYGLNPDGTPKRFSLRQWKKTKLVPLSSGDGFLVLYIHTKRHKYPIYVLKKSITLPPRFGMKNALVKDLNKLAAVIAQDVAEEVIL